MKINVNQKWQRRLQKALPTVLTIVGSAGTIAAAIMAVRSTPKALQLLEENGNKNNNGGSNAHTKKEAVLLCYKCYIPSVIIGAVSLMCIFSANILNKRHQASIAGAYTFIDQSYRRYKAKVKELCGVETHNAIIDSIAKEEAKDVHIICPGLVENSTLDFDCDYEPEIVRTFYDSYSQRYFESTISKVLEAQYHLNRNYVFSGNASINELYEFLGLEKMDNGDELGWSMDDEILWIDFNHHKITLDDGMEILVIDMVFDPVKLDYCF